MKSAEIIIEKNQFTLKNRWIKRVLEFNAGGIITTGFSFEGQELLKKIHHEFQIAVNRKIYTGYSEKLLRAVDGNVEEHRCDLEFIRAEKSIPDKDYQRLDLHFNCAGGVLVLRYEIAENLPAMRKRLIFTAGEKEALLENLIFDDTPIVPGEFADCDIYTGMDETPARNCFTRSGDTDFLRIYNPAQKLGFYLGNTAPGVLRYFMVYPDWYNLCVGYNASSAPFAKYLAPGESFVSAEALTSFYRGGAADGLDTWRQVVRSRLPELADPGDIMYCSWIPLYKNINGENIAELAEAAAESGFTAFVIDAGWFADESDWLVDPEKFPRGLKVAADHIHALGMKFGLWFNIGTDYGMKNAPEAFAAIQSDGTIKKLGWDYPTSPIVQCFGSDYRDMITAKLDELARDYQVDYFKMDFSSISSPYGHLPFGCHAHDHRYHRGFADSFTAMYEGFFKLREELKRRHPELMLDFSFEAFGMEEPTIAALECSELNHLTNLTGLFPANQHIVKIRRDFIRNSASLPPERLMHGLPALKNESAVEYFLTSLCGMPLVSGDLRQLDKSVKNRLSALCKAYRETASEHLLSGFKVLFNNEDGDGFCRYAEDGTQLWCVFNRADKELILDAPEGMYNAEDGSCGVRLAPRECGLFILRS